MKQILIAFSIMLISITTLFSQDMSNAYSVWGFRAPFLKSGEFLATASGNFYSTESSYNYEIEPDRFNESDYSYMNFYLRGMLAITDKFLIYTTLNIYPQRESVNRYGNDDYENKSTSTYNAYFYPNISLVLRPIKNLELGGSVYTYKTKNEYETIYSDPDSNPYQYNYDYKYFGANFSINYYGKLWNK